MWRPRPSAWPRRSRVFKAKSRSRTPAWATRASWRARPRRWWLSSASASPTSRRLWLGCKISWHACRSRLERLWRSRRRTEQFVDAPHDGPGAAQPRLACRAGHARRDLQVLDAVERAALVQRTRLQTVEPRGGDAAAGQAIGERAFV